MRTLRNLRPPLVALAFLAACLLCASGCGGSDKVVTVTGRVTHKDKPVPGLTVSFVPQTPTAAGVSTGTTDEDGNYKLTVARTGERGAVLGTHKVWVSMARPTEDFDKAANKKAFRGGAPQVPPEIAEVLQKYGSAEKTPLTVEVKADEPVNLQLD
jgi:hypothetical protein